MLFVILATSPRAQGRKASPVVDSCTSQTQAKFGRFELRDPYRNIRRGLAAWQTYAQMANGRSCLDGLVWARGRPKCVGHQLDLHNRHEDETSVRSAAAMIVAASLQYAQDFVMTSNEHILSKKPIVPKRNKSLLTCEFDEQLLQLPGLLGALTPKLEAGWQSFSLGPGSTATDQLANDLTSQLPPLIRPLQPGQQGSTGSVPLSHSFTWTRLQPRLECSETPNGDGITEKREFNLVLEPFIEPEVILLLTADQIKGLTRKTVSRNSTQTAVLTLRRILSIESYPGPFVEQEALTLIFAGIMNARFGLLNSLESHLGGRFGVGARRTERHFHLCADRQLFLASTNFQHKRSNRVT
ncbi:hypothetical protein CLF_108392 [Clonorchis sinensis]|uniref:Uncharacterized protein n=1 Tax=Clonorchis sinensis TaxID=79923 RepID=G7YRL0_CLOSI|nr:hypothetical protein CLF_108392 [Clonorchis sinensis]